MTIVLSAYYFGKTSNRLGKYTTSLIFSLAKLFPEVSFVVLIPAETKKVLPRNCSIQVITKHATRGEFDLQSARFVTKNNADILHFFYFPRVVETKAALSVTIHDLDFLNRGFIKFWTQYKAGKFLKRASMIATPSDCVRKEVSRIFSEPLDSICVVTGSVSDSFTKAPDLAAIKDVTSRLNLADNFILHVGRIRKSSNILELMKAFARVVQDSRFQKSKLVFAGRAEFQKNPQYYIEKELKEIAREMKIHQSVIFTRVLKEQDLSVLYHAAKGVVCLQGHQYFPAVLLEAMKAGTPTITPKTAMYQEFAPENALFYDLEQPKTLSYGLQLLLNTNVSKAENVREGFNKMLTFSWDKSAESLMREWAKRVE